MPINLKEACFNNLIDYWKSIAINTFDNENYIGISTGITMPLFNPIFLKETAEQLPTLQTSIDHSIWCDSNRNEEIQSNFMQKLEFIMENVPIMWIDLGQLLSQEPQHKITIRTIEDGSDLSNWIIPIQIAFEMDDGTALGYRQRLEQASKKMLHFIALEDDKVVACASIFLHNDFAGLYNLSVLPEYRKQGIARALHYARLFEAKKRGYEYATLQATPMASSLASHLGFETLSILSIYKLG